MKSSIFISIRGDKMEEYRVMEKFYIELDKGYEALKKKGKEIKFALYLLQDACEEGTCSVWGFSGETTSDALFDGLSVILAEVIIRGELDVDEALDEMREHIEYYIKEMKKDGVGKWKFPQSLNSPQ